MNVLLTAGSCKSMFLHAITQLSLLILPQYKDVLLKRTKETAPWAILVLISALIMYKKGNAWQKARQFHHSRSSRYGSLEDVKVLSAASE